ncbi:hypothetical protein JAAARDRAFT_119249 [Jaapia argillacea MUCL 33604]|uniref:CENP-V/GFA domain-containing protein n=1 Tax=Jaapia argillacea MUCL 33604 TaxID=933084 RepID=A0A067QA62_9AGAM|nr:hypothetical protein JAAARDRAFT_119249 [Jaapia argillacea MUCL 33604]
MTLTGGCFCGNVRYSVNGIPVMSAYCHCTNCQRLTGCPFVHTIHFEASAFSWADPGCHQAQLDGYTVSNKPWKTRWRCKQCGTTVASFNSNSNRWSVWGAQLDRDEDGQVRCFELVQPTAHVFYGTRMLDINDNLGKWEGYEQLSRRVE